MQNQLAGLDEPQSAKQLSGNTTRDKTQIGIIVIIAMRETKMPQKSVEFNSIFFLFKMILLSYGCWLLILENDSASVVSDRLDIRKCQQFANK